jgi:hypothetical protein
MNRLGCPKRSSVMGVSRVQPVPPIIILESDGARLAKKLAGIDFANTFLVADRTQSNINQVVCIRDPRTFFLSRSRSRPRANDDESHLLACVMITRPQEQPGSWVLVLVASTWRRWAILLTLRHGAARCCSYSDLNWASLVNLWLRCHLS